MNWELWTPILIAVVAAIPGVLAWISGRNKDDADAADIITEAAGKMVERQEEQFAALRQRCNERVAAVEKNLAALDKKHELLRQDYERVRERNRELLAENKQIKLDLGMLRAENHELWRGVMTAIGQLNDNNIVPQWQPTAEILKRYGMKNNGSL